MSPTASHITHYCNFSISAKTKLNNTINLAQQHLCCGLGRNHKLLMSVTTNVNFTKQLDLYYV